MSRLTVETVNDDTVRVLRDGHPHGTVTLEPEHAIATLGRQTLRLPATRAGLSALAAFVDDGALGVSKTSPAAHPFARLLVGRVMRGMRNAADLLERNTRAPWDATLKPRGAGVRAKRAGANGAEGVRGPDDDSLVGGGRGPRPAQEEPMPLGLARRMRAEGLVVPPILFSRAADQSTFFHRDLDRSYVARVACALSDMRRAIQGDVPGPAGSTTDWVDTLLSCEGVFSPDGRPYRSLLRTLPVVTRAIPAKLLARLSSVRLERPLTETQLACVLARVEENAPFDPHRAHDVTLLMRMSDDELSEHLATAAILTTGDVAGPLADRARSLALVLRSIYLPTRRSFRRVMRAYGRYVLHVDPAIVGKGQRAVKTARPPHALPEAQDVRFLDDMGAILDEGARMQHCAARYAVRAVRGELFMFHVERDGAHATVAVDTSGTVTVSGPKNRVSGACQLAMEIVGAWAGNFDGSQPELDDDDGCGRPLCRALNPPPIPA